MPDALPKKSTIVRSFSRPLSRAHPRLRDPATIRRAFGLLERYAPGLGSRWAERLWCTLPPGSPKPVPPLAERGMRSTLRITLTNATGATQTPIATEVWGTGPRTVYLLHGWGGHRGQLGAFVGPLVAAGYRVVSFDAPSHGDSGPGRFGPGRSLIPEFAQALAAVVDAFGPAHAVVAHSLGAGATAFAVIDGLKAERLVFIAPMSDATVYSYGFAELFGFGERIRSGLMRRLELRTGRPIGHFSMARRAAETAGLPPLLVVHDREDKQIPLGQGRAIAEGWAGAALVDTRGLGHQRILRDPDVVELVAGFLVAPSVLVDDCVPATERAVQTSGSPT